MVGEMVRQNVNDRIGTVKTLGRGLFDDVKAIFTDVRNRVVDGTEAQFAKRYSPVTGTVGSLPEDLMALPLSLGDHAGKFMLSNAQITRRWLGRVR